MQTSRRNFIIGASSLLVAPAIVKYSNLMPVKNFTWLSAETRDFIRQITWVEYDPGKGMYLPDKVPVSAARVIARLEAGGEGCGWEGAKAAILYPTDDFPSPLLPTGAVVYRGPY